MRTNPINAYKKIQIRINETFLLLNKEDINSGMPKQVNILNQAHMQTYTYANTDF